SLHRATRLNFIARKLAVDHPVQSDRIERHALDVANQRRAGASWEADDLCIWYSLTQPGDDFPAGLRTPTIKFLRSKHTGPGVKQLHGIDTGVKLCRQVLNRSPHQKINQSLESVRIAIGEQACWCLI